MWGNERKSAVRVCQDCGSPLGIACAQRAFLFIGPESLFIETFREIREVIAYRSN